MLPSRMRKRTSRPLRLRERLAERTFAEPDARNNVTYYIGSEFNFL